MTVAGRVARRVAGVVAVVVAATVALDAIAVAAPSSWRPPKPKDVTGVAVAPVNAKQRPTWTAGGREVKAPPPVAWPAPGKATVDLAAAATSARDLTRTPVTRAGSLPIWVSATPTAAGRVNLRTVPSSTVDRVTVEVLDRGAAAKAGVSGLALKVGRADGVRATGAVTVRVDYSSFAGAYGGDWASRLRMVSLLDGKPVPSRNDPTANTVSAVVPVTATGATLLAVTAGASGDNGDYSATSLTPASTWQVAQQTGSFAWSYPVRMVPAVGGPEPTVALSYSSGALDGRTGGTNTQGSWIGDGWDLWPGYIERQYQACGEDKDAVGGVDPNNKTLNTGDLCWHKPEGNATISLNGRGTELVKSTGNTWKGVSDDGSKIELLKNTSFSNSDDDGEYWKVTTVDGTQYFFGRNTGPGGASGTTATKSVWTAPVYGNHPNEPGYTAGDYVASRRTQGWRWNLDYVVDPHGNTMTYFYERETGAYARDGDLDKRTTYDRGGYLTRIEYGNRTDAASTVQAAARVLFDVADRCDANCWSGSDPLATSWLDTPWDQYCKAAPCTDQLAPTFWTQKRLSRIRTHVYSGSGTTYNDVEWITLRHTYLQSGGNEGKPMWLAGITRTGKVTTAGGVEVSQPEIVFDPGAEALANRVDGPADGRSNLFRYRINTITTETGAQIAISYSTPECTRTALPQPHANTKRCYPQWYGPDGEDPTLDWFHKYVVKRVDVYDNTGGFEHEQTNYDYLDTPAWHYDDSELIKPKKRTWSQFRGYGQVRVRKGLESGVQSVAEYLYLRGMDGDRQPNDGTRDIWITDSQGVALEDHEAYAGMLREQKTLNGVGGAVVTGTINTPVKQGPTATSGPLKAWMTNVGTVRTRTPLWNGSTRWTKTVTAFNADNLPFQVDDLGDEGTPDDDICTRTQYARNAAAWILDKVKKVEKVGVNCDTTPTLPADMLSSQRITYDLETNDWNTYLPVKADVAKVEEIDSWSGGTPVWITAARSKYDANGRVTEAYDGLSRKASTAYTPAAAGPVTSTTATNPAGHTATTTYATAWHLPLTISDNPNSAVGELTYDGLGRRTKAWYPGRSKATNPTTPNLEYIYLVRNDAPTAITTKTLTAFGTSTYKTQITLYDGLLRPRQTQTQAPGGGRTLTDTVYDSRGLVEWTSNPYYDTTNAPPDTTLVAGPGTPAVPALTENLYDGAGRITAAIFKINGTEQWRTHTWYGGDRSAVTPPEGGTKTETLLDGRDRTRQVRQYHSHTATTFDATTYTYTDRGELATVADPAGNTWRYTYDQRGRKIKDEDPDRGETTYTYDAAGQLTTVTDSRGITLAYTYDDLGRKTTVRDGGVTGDKRAEWVYDTLPHGVGRLTKSIRYEPAGSTNAYTNEIAEYDTAGRPTSTEVTIPASQGSLCAAGGTTPCTYTYATTYRNDGQVGSTTLPAAGGLPSEELFTTYNEVSAPDGLLSAAQIYADATYNKLGQLTQRLLGEDGSHTWLTYTIDQNTGRLTNANAIPELKPEVFNATYTYDDAGNVITIADQPAGGATDTQCYTYDYLRRLTEAWTPADGTCHIPEFMSQIGGPASYWRSYEYTGPPGLAGSRTKEIWHTAVGNGTHTYTYPAQGGAAGTHPHAVQTVTNDYPRGYPTPDSTDSYSYDNTGNTTSRPATPANQTLTWDNEGHLATVADNGKNTSYTYDADGNRLIRRDPTGATLYLPDGTEVRAPTTGAASATRYYTHLGATIAVRTLTGLTWLAGDHHNTTEAALNDTDLSLARRRTLPFGDTRGTTTGTWPSAMDKGFVGGTIDNTGLTHLGAREYDPKIGRFISVDPLLDLADPQQWNGYSYANNTPVTHSDPSGLCITDSPGCFSEIGIPPIPQEDPAQTGGGNGGSGNGGGDGGKKGFWGQIGSGLKKGFTNQIIDPFVGAYHTITSNYATAYHDINGVLTGEMSALDAAVDIGSIYVTNYKNTLVGTVTAPVEAIGNLIQTPGHIIKGDYEKAAESWSEGAIGAALIAAGGRGGFKPKAPKGAPKNVPDCTHSFDPATPVLLSDGTKPIAEVTPGDVVLAEDPETGHVEPREVKRAHTNLDTDLTDLIVVTEDGRTATLKTTQHHPFWSEDRNGWVDAEDLRPGEQLRTNDGSSVIVGSVHSYDGASVMHDLTVETVHTYYVLAGQTPVLVHNCDPVENRKPGELSMDLFDAELQGVKPAFSGSDAFTKAMGTDGNYLWAVDNTGRLGIAPAGPGIKHTTITGGRPAYAGQFTVHGGRVTRFDNWTGHYTPCKACSRTSLQRGSDAFLGAGVRIPLSAWVDYGGI
ncbi:polymorphic toxin-type HINT domain-containing protein [Phytohabitans sp. ZYX-F-186]|uniref:Polymorphic toxin-type HINT domain-containing protein n=1 Tax=Phytohabitans maris TaxID=3071409 RepID=A0ABU0ZVP4_9ACTN|nr:polymorphic toxin-type HINT domain-containing protein [Phytohabitans sp. ZYX-F-186]MDQ7911103.1 polymorphic toxin-type HINT domain-containing protein [Phytohabitans sp. ZYX-F-186]